MEENDALRELLIFGDDKIKYSEKQLRILEAAIEIFSEKGFAATSTNEIAKKAGVAEGTIFRHYQTKKDLLFSIVLPIMTKSIGSQVAKGFAKTIFESEYQTFEDFIRKLAFNRLAFVKKYSSVVKILLQEVSYHEELREPYIKLFQEHVIGRFTTKIIHFQEKDEIVSLPPDSIIRFIITTIVGTLVTMFILLPDREWDYEQEMENTVQMITNGLLNM